MIRPCDPVSQNSKTDALLGWEWRAARVPKVDHVVQVVAAPNKRSTFGFSLRVSPTGVVQPPSMCGRITRTSPRETIAKEFGVIRFAEVDWHPHCNVAPNAT